MALWIHNPTSTGALQECRQSSFKARKNADKLRRCFWEPSGRRFDNFVRQRESLPRTMKNKPAHRCTPIINGKKTLFEDPEVLLAVELVSWPWRLQEQSHGASTRAPSQQGAQSGCRQRPHQLVDVGLDSSKKAEAAHLVKASSKPTSLAFLGGTAILSRRSQNFWEWAGNGTARNNSQKWNFVVRASTYAFGNVSSMDALSNESKKMVSQFAWNAIEQESLANFVVK